MKSDYKQAAGAEIRARRLNVIFVHANDSFFAAARI